MKTILAVLFLGALGYAAFSGHLSGACGAALRVAVEKLGPEVTGTAVSLEGARAAPWLGSVSIENLQVANPTGYSTEPAYAIRHGALDLDVLSFFKDVKVVDSVVLRGAVIRVERKDGVFNLARLFGDSEGASGADGNADAPPADEEEEQPVVAGAGEDRWIVRHLIIEDSRLELMVGESPLSIELPSIERYELGLESGGLPLHELGKQILLGLSPKMKELPLFEE